MAYQSVFKRYEIKYLLTSKQKETVLSKISSYMEPDLYGHTSIRNIYFDTDSYQLIRHSIEKPAYKEKLRFRSYSKAKSQDEIFVELKKKYRQIVYKRRLLMPEEKALAFFSEKDDHPIPESQILKELRYFRDFYRSLHPVLFLSYERDAYRAKDGSQFRITFDDRILCRNTDLTLSSEPGGFSLLAPDRVLMELKCPGGIPLQLARFLSEEGIFKTPFSKYGTAYKTLLFQNLKGDLFYA